MNIIHNIYKKWFFPIIIACICIFEKRILKGYLWFWKKLKWLNFTDINLSNKIAYVNRINLLFLLSFLLSIIRVMHSTKFSSFSRHIEVTEDERVVRRGATRASEQNTSKSVRRQKVEKKNKTRTVYRVYAQGVGDEKP